MARGKELPGRAQLAVRRFRDGRWENLNDTVSGEVSLLISWSEPERAAGGEARLWAWPENLASLALGHALLELSPGSFHPHRMFLVTPRTERHYLVVMGDSSAVPTPQPPAAVGAAPLVDAMRVFIRREGNWDGTGCFHRAGVYDPSEKQLLAVVEDIGRHNCLDRLAGWSLETRTPLANKVLLTTARLTASLCAKALRAGFRVLVSRSAVTTAAVALAEDAAATLAGFARPDEGRLTVFSDIRSRIIRNSRIEV